ncbi:hypothetical protein P7D22_15580 [Lichenihabitans sp. Uapishka_5]|uniref:hypothetical protein n=1 Tax=Lichenihabitans sp. Uapishka_5 TaxID=3037302 RepID=UPI0029E7E98D|nr:hypothetical protein [Lichenihabitans sp. Uapishka_5]MDX7952591.1 hypothetical protein [Lichenihabitans sp. Uapishka_5]
MVGVPPMPEIETPLDPALERHLSDPAEMTEEVSGAQERARQRAESPTEPDATTEGQPT